MTPIVVSAALYVMHMLLIKNKYKITYAEKENKM